MTQFSFILWYRRRWVPSKISGMFFFSLGIIFYECNTNIVGLKILLYVIIKINKNVLLMLISLFQFCVSVVQRWPVQFCRLHRVFNLSGWVLLHRRGDHTHCLHPRDICCGRAVGLHWLPSRLRLSLNNNRNQSIYLSWR